MPNIATVLKEEISRITRKELRTETEVLKKANSRYRSEIAELKRRIAEMEKQLKAILKQGSQSKKVAAANAADDRQVRFSAAGLKKMRERHGLSAATLGEILGTSLQTIYNWETGKTRPPKEQIAKIAILRKMSKCEIQQGLAAMRAEK
jgi:DNA-binding transcriptional regulator YiaG